MPVIAPFIEPYPRHHYVPYRRTRGPTWLEALNDWKVKSGSQIRWIDELRREKDNRAVHTATPVLTCVVYERPAEDVQMHLRCASWSPLEALNGVKSAVKARLGAKVLLNIYGLIEDNRIEGTHNRFSVMNISYTYRLESWAATEYRGEGMSKREAQQAAAERLLRGENYCMFIVNSNANGARRQ
ncbi:hypothetical protein RhiTH_006783 [Rhizoctonia solani]